MTIMTNFAAQINEFHCIVHLLLIFSTKQRGPLQATDDKHSMKSGLPYTSKSGLRYKSNFGKAILKKNLQLANLSILGVLPFRHRVISRNPHLLSDLPHKWVP